MSKVLEKIMYQRVYTFLDLHGVLYQSQYGFHNKHSCSQAINELTGKILQAKEAGLHSSSIFLDLSKAFNTLDHRVLLQKLDRYGIRSNANEWFSSYLSNRSLTARIQTKPGTITYSESFDITYGTAQGSCLGPLLFIIFCNDIQLLSLFGSLILFAGETTLTNSHKSESFLQYSLIQDMGLLMGWFNVNKLSLNLNKTVMMSNWPTKKKITVKIGGYEIPSVESTRFLGVTLDNTLSWMPHIATLISKLNANKHLKMSECVTDRMLMAHIL